MAKFQAIFALEWQSWRVSTSTSKREKYIEDLCRFWPNYIYSPQVHIVDDSQVDFILWIIKSILFIHQRCNLTQKSNFIVSHDGSPVHLLSLSPQTRLQILKSWRRKEPRDLELFYDHWAGLVALMSSCTSSRIWHFYRILFASLQNRKHHNWWWELLRW